MIKAQPDMSTKLISKVYKCLNNIQLVILPSTCILCHQASRQTQDICDRCINLLPTITRPCLRCSLPLPHGDSSSSICGACLTLQPINHYSVSAFDYKAPLDKLIRDFKYHAKLHNGRVLSFFLLQAIQGFYQARQLPELIIPIPLHRSKLRQRGFNQSIEIAHYLSKQLNIPVNHQLCIRKKNTQAQMSLSATQRKSNLHKAFTLNKKKSLYPIRRVAIVDDVVTTMTTTSELSKLLLSNGAEEIHIWSLARTCK